MHERRPGKSAEEQPQQCHPSQASPSSHWDPSPVSTKKALTREVCKLHHTNVPQCGYPCTGKHSQRSAYSDTCRR